MSSSQRAGVPGARAAAARLLARAATVVVFCSAAGAVAAAPPPAGAGTVAVANAWRQHALWDDGNAEFSAYEVTWARYGQVYPGRAILVVVKEPWAPELDVKADTPRPGGFDVMKLNHARDVPTGIYTYHQMASVFVRRDTGALQKITATSAELCGVSNADMTRGVLRTRSYFDGQGDRARRWPLDTLPEDGLPLTLRDYVEGEYPGSIGVFPSLLMGRYADLTPSRWTLRRVAAGAVAVPAGTFDAVTLRLEQGASWLEYVFETAAPHRLVRFQRDDGTEYRLAKSERIPYWRLHDPGGEQWLPMGVR